MVRLDDRHIEELYTRLRETDSRVRRVEESLAGTLARLAAVGAGVEALTASCGVRPPSSLRLFLLAPRSLFALLLPPCLRRCLSSCGLLAAAASACICAALASSVSCLHIHDPRVFSSLVAPILWGLSQKWEEPAPEEEEEEQEQEGKVFTPQQAPQSYGQFPSVVRAAEP